MVHPRSIPTYRDELLRSTALTPTQHKGGGFKAILGIAAAVAIAFVAPQISLAIGLSGAIGATAGGAVVGAALGGLSAYAMGGNPLLGAAGGALGGGIAGFNAGGAGIGAVETTTGSQVAGDLSTSSLGTGAVDFSPAGGYGLTTAAGPETGFAADLQGIPALEGSSYAPADFSSTLSAGAGAGAGMEAGTLGLDSSGSVTGSTPGLDTNYQTMATPDQADQAPGVGSTPGGFANLDGNYLSQNDQILSQGKGFDFSSGTGSVAQQAGVDPALRPQPGILERTFSSSGNATAGLSGTDGSTPSFWQGVKDTATSPKFLTQTGLQLGANAAAQMLVKNPSMSDSEKALLDRQDAATARQNAQVDAQNAFKSQSAEDLRRQALYYDPNYTGTQDYATALNRRKRQEFDALSGVPANAPQARAGLKRRYDLDTARSSTAAFDSGYQRGAGEQTRLTSQAAGLYPSPDSSYSASLSGLQNTASNYYARLRKEQEGLAGTIAGVGKDLAAGGLEASS